jgi:hypothetical protein
MANLLSSVLNKFIRRQFLYNSDREVQSLKPISELTSLNISEKTCQKPPNLIDIGTKAKLLLSESILPDEKKTVFRRNCLNFYVVSASYLQQNLPFNRYLIKYAQFIHPEKRNQPGATSAISNLSMKVSRVLNNVLQQVFLVDAQSTVEDVCDKVRTQWQVY